MDRMTTMATGNPTLDMDIERKEKASFFFICVDAINLRMCLLFL